MKRQSSQKSITQARHDRDWLLDDIARNRRQRLLRHPCLIEDGLHQFPGFRLVEEFHRLAERVPEDLLADVVEHADADPEHVIGIEIRAEPAQGHEEGDGRADRQRSRQIPPHAGSRESAE